MCLAQVHRLGSHTSVILLKLVLGRNAAAAYRGTVSKVFNAFEVCVRTLRDSLLAAKPTT